MGIGGTIDRDAGPGIKFDMTSDQLRDIIGSLYLTQVEVAALLGVTDRTVSLWVTGKQPVPLHVARLMRLFAAGKLTLRQWRDA
jgi:transcriptional regulator with XRE-family HTH domain